MTLFNTINTVNSVSTYNELVSSYDDLLFPKTITEYRTTLMFDSEEAKQQLIGIIAERVSSLYAAFLTSEGHQQRSKELSFNMDPSIFPSCQAVEKFKIT